MSLNINMKTNKGSESKFKKVEYVKIMTGVPIRLRILNKNIHDKYIHYISSRKLSVVCPGEDCPICLNNRRLYRENPGEKGANIKGIIPRSQRWSAVVYNRTMVKLTSTGEVVYPTANGRFPPVHPTSGEILATVKEQPLNQIQVLERGWDLFSQIIDRDQKTTSGEFVYKTDKEGNLVIENGAPVIEKAPEPIGMENYDIIVEYSGNDKRMVPSVTARPDLDDVVEVTEDLPELETLGIRLSCPEIEKLLAGVSLSDIYAARRETTTIVSGASKEVEDSVDDLFAE